MRSDCASIPTRGSRLVGRLSIILTSVVGSGAWEQERRGSTTPAVTSNRIVIVTDVCRERAQSRSFASLRMTILSCAHLSGAAASRIRDLSQDRRPLRSRSRRHIAWPSMPRLMREQRKSHCLLGFRRKAELVREMQSDPQGRDFMAQHGHQRWILRASARDDHLVITAPRPESRHHEALHCIRNRSCRQSRCRRHYVSLAGAVAELKKSAHVFPAEFLATRRSRRLLPTTVGAQQLRDHTIQYASRGRDFAIAIIAPCEKLLHHRINHHVAGAGVKSNHLA